MDDSQIMRIEEKIDTLNDKVATLNLQFQLELQSHKHTVNNAKFAVALLGVINSVIITLLTLKVI